jgi:hypothetical protein
VRCEAWPGPDHDAGQPLPAQPSKSEKERILATARELYEGRKQEFISGRGSVDILIEYARVLLNAERAVGETPDAELAATERFHRESQWLYELEQKRFQARRVAISDFGQARQQLALAERAFAKAVRGYARTRPNRLPAKDLERLWRELDDADGRAGAVAMAQLVAVASQAVPFLHARLLNPAENPVQVQQWILDLDSPRFATRRTAAAGLEKLGEAAEPALRRALANQPSLEVYRRIEALLLRIEQGKTLLPHRVRTWRVLKVLEIIGDAAARRALESLAKGPSALALTQEAQAALQRLDKQETATAR